MIKYNVFMTRHTTDILLASLTFDDDNDSHLELENSSPEAKLLRDRWDETAAKSELAVRRTIRSKNEDGTWLRSQVVETVAKDSKDYPYAIVQYLSTTYGYSLYTVPLSVE